MIEMNKRTNDILPQALKLTNESRDLAYKTLAVVSTVQTTHTRAHTHTYIHTGIHTKCLLEASTLSANFDGAKG